MLGNTGDSIAFKIDNIGDIILDNIIAAKLVLDKLISLFLFVVICKKKLDIAIIGFGPRGLHSLECFVSEAIQKQSFSNLAIKIFDSNANLGVGFAWKLEQSDSNWSNISNHALRELNGREPIHSSFLTIPGFKSYTEWSKDYDLFEEIDEKKFNYSLRSQIGAYLNQRAQSIVRPLVEKGIIQILQHNVSEAHYNESFFSLTLDDRSVVHCDVCLLTIGHTPTKLREETIENTNHAHKNNLVYIHNPYVEDIISKNYTDQNVAIIGLGLSMIDVIRMVTIDQGGKFVSTNKDYYLNFRTHENVPKSIIPYSLDGLPCVPKPYSSVVDQQFEPSKDQLQCFRADLDDKINQLGDNFDATDLIDLFSRNARLIYQNRYTNSDQISLKNLINNWILHEDEDHSLFLDTSLPFREYIDQTIQMAMGDIQPSLDYFIGQVWRHFQPTMYRVFAFANISPKAIKEIIDIDERLKRYSYGPPVESMLQILALIDSNILCTDFIDDPSINKTQDAWRFRKNDRRVDVQILINSVMDAPDLSQLNSSLITSLKEQRLILSVADGLGIKTNNVAQAENEFANVPLYIMGRNAKGSILGADAILECFSPDISNWAKHSKGLL